MDSSRDSIGIDVPESLVGTNREEPIMQEDTRIGVDIAKSVFQVGVEDRPGRVSRTD